MAYTEYHNYNLDHSENLTCHIVKSESLQYPDTPITVRTHVGWAWGMRHFTQQWSKSMETLAVRVKV